MARPRTYVEAPPVTPLPYGLLSTALVLDDLTGTRALGVHYEPAFCGAAYDANGVCQEDPDLGTLEVSVDAAGEATITAAGHPASGYSIEWGDETPAQDSTDPDGETHTYADPGTYVVLVRDDEVGYVATATVTVEDAEASGPFDADVAFSKIEHDGLDLVDGDPFALYHLFRCNPVGITAEAFQERARTALRLGEQRGLERVTGHRLARTAGAVDLTPTPGTAVHPVEGLGILEGWSADNYGGVPVVHVPRAAGTHLTTYGAVIRGGTGGRLETVQGALVASGGGYGALVGPQTDAEDPGSVVAPGAGEAWLYVTGQVVVRRGPAIEVGPVMDRTPALNVQAALTERLYTSTWECITGAVLVDLTYGAGTP